MVKKTIKKYYKATKKELSKINWEKVKSGVRAVDRFTRGTSEGVDRALGYERVKLKLQKHSLRPVRKRRQVLTQGGHLLDLY